MKKGLKKLLICAISLLFVAILSEVQFSGLEIAWYYKILLLIILPLAGLYGLQGVWDIKGAIIGPSEIRFFEHAIMINRNYTNLKFVSSCRFFEESEEQEWLQWKNLGLEILFASGNSRTMSFHSFTEDEETARFREFRRLVETNFPSLCMTQR